MALRRASIVGVAEPDGSGRAIAPETLFQIGSISKLVIAALVHQFVAEGRFARTARLAGIAAHGPFSRGGPITVQQLLDHRSGLPGNAPVFPAGGLWIGYEPGNYWAYSNTGYVILGKLGEQVGKKPLARLARGMVLKPLGMERQPGRRSCRGPDSLYAQGI